MILPDVDVLIYAFRPGGERHWKIFRRLCIAADSRGPRVTDAWFAALAIEWGCEWITMDRAEPVLRPPLGGPVGRTRGRASAVSNGACPRHPPVSAAA